jgi:sugar phosphate isomerase/epimerase
MAELGIQLYTLRDLDVSFPTLLEDVADAGFDGVEYAYQVLEADGDEVRETLDTTGLSVPSAHVRVEELEENLAETVETYRDLQCERLVIPALDAADFESAEATRETAARLDSLAADLTDHDYSLHYHNHDFEFADVGGRSALAVFLEASDDVQIELDVGLAAWAGGDPVEILETHGDRIDLLHCTDYNADADEVAHESFGAGDLDTDAVIGAAEDAGVDWFIYENGSQDDPAGELEYAREEFVGRFA